MLGARASSRLPALVQVFNLVPIRSHPAVTPRALSRRSGVILLRELNQGAPSTAPLACTPGSSAPSLAGSAVLSQDAVLTTVWPQSHPEGVQMHRGSGRQQCRGCPHPPPSTPRQPPCHGAPSRERGPSRSLIPRNNLSCEVKAGCGPALSGGRDRPPTASPGWGGASLGSAQRGAAAGTARRAPRPPCRTPHTRSVLQALRAQRSRFATSHTDSTTRASAPR